MQRNLMETLMNTKEIAKSDMNQSGKQPLTIILGGTLSSTEFQFTQEFFYRHFLILLNAIRNVF